jgi:hypothetical protein
VPDGPPAERRDCGALALAGRRGLPGDLAEERPDRRRGERGDLAVVMGCERDQVAAVGADGVARLVGVREIGQEVVDMAQPASPGLCQGPATTGPNWTICALWFSRSAQHK